MAKSDRGSDARSRSAADAEDSARQQLRVRARQITADVGVAVGQAVIDVRLPARYRETKLHPAGTWEVHSKVQCLQANLRS